MKPSYKLPNVLDKSKKPYIESLQSTGKYSNYKNPLKEEAKYRQLKTLDSKESEMDANLRTRHNTQPRSHSKPFGFVSDYAISSKPKPTYMNPLQPRIKSGSNSNLPIKDNLTSLRREYQSEAYKHMVPHSTPAKLSKQFTSKSKRNTPGMGAKILSSVGAQNKSNMELQGFTIRPDTKYTSLAEVHQRGYLPRNSNLGTRHK